MWGLKERSQVGGGFIVWTFGMMDRLYGCFVMVFDGACFLVRRFLFSCLPNDPGCDSDSEIYKHFGSLFHDSFHDSLVSEPSCCYSNPAN